jgi:hypothetical protein
VSENRIKDQDGTLNAQHTAEKQTDLKQSRKALQSQNKCSKSFKSVETASQSPKSFKSPISPEKTAPLLEGMRDYS